MKRTIEIAASFTGTISTGNWENEKPFYYVKEVIDIDPPLSALNPSTGEIVVEESMVIDDAFIINRQKELHDMCYNQFKQHANVSFQERLAKQYRNIRWYPGKDQMNYASVTSMINWDTDFHIPPDELQQYGARGTIVHKQVEVFLDTGEWKEPKDIPEIYPELVTMKKGSLNLEHDNVDFRAFYKAYPFKVTSLEEQVLNHDYKYGGRYDILCTIDKENPGKWAKIEGVLYDVPTILDIKTGASLDKTKGYKQQTAYAKCLPEVQQIGLIHLTKDNKSGYAKPSIIQDLDKYWHLFLKDQENFNQRYGI